MWSDNDLGILRLAYDALTLIEPDVPEDIREHVQRALTHLAIVEFSTRPDLGDEERAMLAGTEEDPQRDLDKEPWA